MQYEQSSICTKGLHSQDFRDVIQLDSSVETINVSTQWICHSLAILYNLLTGHVVQNGSN